ncbi:MAG: chorismate-binding protein [Paramuribaculum sp.]|nr:chorismate-binding protein [Paramuribaculum sp.]
MTFKDLHNDILEFLDKKKPFAVYSLPNTDVFHIIDTFESSDTTVDTDLSFSVSRFNADIKQDTELFLQTARNEKALISTDFDDYRHAFDYIQSKLESVDEKVVLSRVYNLSSKSNPIYVAEKLFEGRSRSFRYLFFSPFFGFWFGATPELLLEYDFKTHGYKTMALAGTRKSGTDIEWDTKNMHEHNAVCAFIENELSKLNLKYSKSSSENVKYGEIEHLCHRYTGNAMIDPCIIAEALNPTPAVCGYPRDKARLVIGEVEKHDRECYAGLINVLHDNKFYSFVNLRCCKVSKTNIGYCYHIFAGGGINQLSDINEEWNETESKMKSIIDVINA